MKYKKLLLPALAMGAVVAMPMPALADDLPHREPGFFIGGGAIYTRVKNEFYESDDFPNQPDDFDDDHVSWKALAGFRFNPVLSIEGQYVDFGDAENNSARAEADGWTAALVADIPLRYVQPYAKAGALFWNEDAHIRGTNLKASDDGTDFFWGLGVRVPLGEGVDLRAEYERYDLDGDNVDTKIDAASLNLQFNFGG
ncbi:porin family protein [Solimonas soli]|uniref:porin family protein n=1 Tax=Solimonas soli TaxID=413479 RepID=UPI000489C33D|nr:porin family protein [Solimonas soli]